MFRVFRQFGKAEPIQRRRNQALQKRRDDRIHPVNGIMRLQRSFGNQIVQRLIKSGNIMAKLVIGKQNDPYEREADQVANRVMQMPEQDIHDQSEVRNEDEVLQSKSISSGISPIVQKKKIAEDEVIQKQTELEDEEQIQAQKSEKEELIQPLPIAADIQRQPKAPTKLLDKKALKIINTAQDNKLPIEKRAIQAVKSIINVYYPTQANLVNKIVYNASEPGLMTSVATFPKAKGIITVGRYFITNTTRKGFARRVLQVDHELEHIRQQRQGMGGPHKADLREFLAFTREALSPEVPGTGHISHSTRVALIDAALKHYYNLNNATRSRYANDLKRLLKARAGHAMQSGRSHKPPPGPTP